MHNIYLIRHPRPKQTGKSRCISRTDLPLDDYGWLQAERLRFWAKDCEPPLQRIYTSPLQRCLKTAEHIAPSSVPVAVCEDLQEMSVGNWENLTFDEIKSRFPEDYHARSQFPGTIPPTGGESMVEAGGRMQNCLDRILQESAGDIAVISHGGINRGFLSGLMEGSPNEMFAINQPWGGITTLKYSNRQYQVVSVGLKPDQWPVEEELPYLFAQYQTPVPVQEHGKAVAAVALDLAEQIENIPINKELLVAACVLHDFARSKKQDHVQEGSRCLRQVGYPKVADLIEGHHDLPQNAFIEAQLLYLADKLVKGTQTISLAERFALSSQKCSTPQAKEAWRKRYSDAVGIVERYQLQIGR